MKDFLYITELFDLYGALLTAKQQECMKMHLAEDFSLKEIAEILGISRQAVHDSIKHAEKSLLDYEDKLKFYRRLEEIRKGKNYDI